MSREISSNGLDFEEAQFLLEYFDPINEQVEIISAILSANTDVDIQKLLGKEIALLTNMMFRVGEAFALEKL